MKPDPYRTRGRLFRKGRHANRTLRITPVIKLDFVFRPVRFGIKPRIVKNPPA